MAVLSGEKTVVFKESRCMSMNPVKRISPEGAVLQNLSNQYPDGKYKRILMVSSRRFCEVQFRNGEIIKPPYEGTLIKAERKKQKWLKQGKHLNGQKN